MYQRSRAPDSYVERGPAVNFTLSTTNGQALICHVDVCEQISVCVCVCVCVCVSVPVCVLACLQLFVRV